MVAFTKYQDTVEKMLTAFHNFTAAGHTLKAVIHSDAPVVASDTQLSNLTQITGTGYTAGGGDIQNDMTESGGTATLTGVDYVWTAGAGDWVAGRYISIQNDSATNKNLVGAWDSGANFTPASGETVTLDFGASVATLV